jgi:antitoxin MazE
MSMKVHVRKWGNSDAVRIPARTLAAAGIKTDDRVEVREEGGRIVIEKAAPPDPITLEWLLEGITPEKLHPEADFGPPVGKEVFW